MAAFDTVVILFPQTIRNGDKRRRVKNAIETDNYVSRLFVITRVIVKLANPRNPCNIAITRVIAKSSKTRNLLMIATRVMR